MVDLSNKTIEELFFNQIKDLTSKTFGAKPNFKNCRVDPLQTFDFQFSDQWLEV